MKLTICVNMKIENEFLDNLQVMQTLNPQITTNAKCILPSRVDSEPRDYVASRLCKQGFGVEGLRL